ncbi:MAG: SRPBCC family protein [Acholeplasmataceae bacterium]|nr:SRPBCC family protein [Acholeplasmataceae bacterium]
MKYQVHIEINKPQHQVSKLFVDVNQMTKWETNLTRVEQNHGILYETNSDGFLVFNIDQKEMKMSVFVERNMLPEQIILVYQVGTTWNRCINYFNEKNGHTIWTMDVEFRFGNETILSTEKFVEQTKKGMLQFKDYIESI